MKNFIKETNMKERTFLKIQRCIFSSTNEKHLKTCETISKLYFKKYNDKIEFVFLLGILFGKTVEIKSKLIENITN